VSAVSGRWRELESPEEVVDAICGLFAERGDALYDETVSQTAHAVQAARLAERDGADGALQVAALLHDIGHLLERDPLQGAGQPERDLRHEEIAARFLANWFGPEVTEPIRHHVAAKRWLVANEPGYAAELSPASVHSLALQGGPMRSEEAAGFLAVSGAAEAVRLRRWDDRAKDTDAPQGDIGEFRELMVEHCRPRGRDR
jgi:phosphonate degradation associated HDIG domain protein